MVRRVKLGLRLCDPTVNPGGGRCYNAAWYGTCGMLRYYRVRFSSHEGLEGFPDVTIAEDTHTSTKMEGLLYSGIRRLCL
jgi:hypothetical protein